jgi:Divergent InlB B-repeat domain
VVLFVLPAVLAAAVLCCSAGGAFAHGTAGRALAVGVEGPGTVIRATFVTGSSNPRLTVAATGSGRVVGPGINCGLGNTDCSEIYAANTSVALAEIPASGAGFVGWHGACTGTGSICTLLMNSPKAVSATFSRPGGSSAGTRDLRSLGAPRVVRTSVGWAVSLHFFTSRSAAALLRLSLDGRLVQAFAFSPHAGPVIVGPFNVARPGQYKFQLTLTDQAGSSSALIWRVCLSRTGCGSYTPARAFVRSLGATAVRTSGGWTVRVRFSAASGGVANIRMMRGEALVGSGNFTFRRGVVLVKLPACRGGYHRIVLTTKNVAGNTYRITWNVLLS